MHASPRIRSRVALLATVCAAAIFGAPLAGAHDSVVGGNPANGEVLQEFPKSVTLEFSGRPREGFNTFAITDLTSGEIIHSGEPTVVDRNVTLELPEGLAAGSGEYRIGFQITSSDGHSTRGMTTFSVAGDGDAGASAGGTGSPAVEDTGSETVEEGEKSIALQIALAAVGVLALISVAILAVARQRRRNEDNQ